MSNQALAPFHVAVPVDDIAAARKFYGELLGCPEGRSDTHWVDFNLFGHQFVVHYKPRSKSDSLHHNPVDGHEVPVPHYGVVLAWDAWQELAERLRAGNVGFVIEPYIRFQGRRAGHNVPPRSSRQRS